MKNYLIISLLFLSVGISQQKWNINSMYIYNGLMYSPTSDKPYTGIVFSFLDGRKEKQWTYKDGEKTGITKYYKNGYKMEEIHYKGKDEMGYLIRNGKRTKWYENGQKQYEGTFKDGKPVGKWTYYNENGSVDKVEEY